MFYPSPYLYAIVGFLNRAIACIMFLSSHAAAFLYPLLASVAATIASSHSLQHSDPARFVANTPNLHFHDISRRVFCVAWHTAAITAAHASLHCACLVSYTAVAFKYTAFSFTRRHSQKETGPRCTAVMHLVTYGAMRHLLH